MIITQLSRETINLANKIYKFHYQAKIYHLNSQMEVNFKRFSMNSRRWKCATSTGNFYLTRICSLFLKFYKNEYIQEVKAWYSRLMKNYFCRLNIECVRALQSSITFEVLGFL